MRLPRKAGAGLARRLLLTGQLMPAEQFLALLSDLDELRPTPENAQYLSTKRQRLGHLLDLDQVPAGGRGG